MVNLQVVARNVPQSKVVTSANSDSALPAASSSSATSSSAAVSGSNSFPDVQKKIDTKESAGMKAKTALSGGGVAPATHATIQQKPATATTATTNAYQTKPLASVVAGTATPTKVI